MTTGDLWLRQAQCDCADLVGKWKQHAEAMNLAEESEQGNQPDAEQETKKTAAN